MAGHSGDVFDAMAGTYKPHHNSNGKMFTTLDSDNDDKDGDNCALIRGGGWWYGRCSASDLHMNLVSNGRRGRWVSDPYPQTQETRDVVESHMLVKLNLQTSCA